MGMKAGDFDRRVQVMRSGLLDDGNQNIRMEFLPFGQAIAASRPDILADEKFTSGTLIAIHQTRFRVRCSTFTRGILPSDRLVCEGLTYAIVAIKEVERRFTIIEITCLAQVL